MVKDEKHTQLRLLLINKILETASPEKLSKSSLQKKGDAELVQALFVNSVLAERQFWKNDIQNAAIKLNPEKKFSTNSTSNGLIGKLIKLVEKTKSQNLILIFLFSFPIFCINAQTYTASTLIEKRAYYLNGGARASFGGKSRVTIKIDLPKNTKKWYYSFSTTPGADGTKLLNLGVQIGAALSSGGLTALAAKSFEVPPGSGSADIIILPPEYNDAFLNKEDNNWRFYSDISLQNSKQAVQTVENNYGNSFYIGLRNPSSLSGINIVIEVVAVVEQTDAVTDKGMLYGSLGWKAFERGELDKCVELSKKALVFNSKLCFVKFNIALVHLIQEKDDALDEYISAIADIKDDKTPKKTLAGALEDIRNQKAKTPNLKNLKDVEDLLLNEYKKY